MARKGTVRKPKKTVGKSEKSTPQCWVDVLADVLEMMPPEDRLAFAEGVRSADPQDLAAFRLPRRGAESAEEHKGRVCEALVLAREALGRGDTPHARVIREKSEAMVMGFLRERRARLALRSPQSADDRASYAPVMRCEGVYKHAAFVPPARREELLSAALAEDAAAPRGGPPPADPTRPSRRGRRSSG